MVRYIKGICLLLTIAFHNAEQARILSIFPMPSASHVILGQELSIELAKKGHEVVMITPYPKYPKVTNFTEIFLKDLANDMFSAY